ncbi:MAG TPA: VCBS repeat-containing protein [Candidatus Hydrogenedentes bacterium]|nr:VCBS repeat-containing protein [Candidatus Hydrogenedentota bacterium]
MGLRLRRSGTVAILLVAVIAAAPCYGATSERLPYNHPGLVVDLGAGLWAQPLPMDFDEDGDLDLVVATADTPYNGIYVFENPGGDAKFPVFKPAVRLGDACHNMTVSYIDGVPRVVTPEQLHPDFRKAGIGAPTPIAYKPTFYLGRAKQWKLCDYDGDGVTDLIIGASDWREYGWDNAFDENGKWLHGPLHGYVYFMKNTGTNDAPAYAEAVQVQAGNGPVDVYGCPSPNLADWDGDGDLDLMCGEFLDRITYFENTGSRTEPRYAAGRFLTRNGEPIRMDLEMLQVVALDWDADGDVDLIVGQEDGRVALMDNTGAIEDGVPVFDLPRFFKQEADAVKIGALCTPFGIDWDGDGDEDLIAGDTAGYLNFVENLDNGDTPKWAPPVYLEAAGTIIRIQAGPNGSIQGPCEAKWGYTVPNVADWNHDGLPDIVINSIWGEVLWYENSGTRTAPKLEAAKPIEVEWPGDAPKPAWFWWTPKGKQLVTQWRTTPVVVDWNEDGLNDLVMLDQEGYLAFFERRRVDGALHLMPGARVFTDGDGQPLQLNSGKAGKSGRRKLAIVDWDGDGLRDLLVNSKSIDWMKNEGEVDGHYTFKDMGSLDERKLAGHTTCPTIVDWNADGVPDLLTGAEDGFLYYLQNTTR